MDWDRLYNDQGLVIMVAYVSVTLSILLPFQCVLNPDDTYTMATNPAMQCFDTTRHQVMLGFGVCFVLLYPITIFTLIGCVTYRYPALIASGYGLRLVRRYRFLFNRFKPESYFFGLIHFIPTTFMSWVTFSPAPECVEAWCWNFKIQPRRGTMTSVIVFFCRA